MHRRTQGTPQHLLCVGVFLCCAALLVPHGGSATMLELAGPLKDPLQGKTQQPRFESKVELVVLPVSVLDSDDLPVDGLTSGDFRIFEDETEQEVALVLSPDEAPLDIALLMDMSSSMWSEEEAAKSSVLAFLDLLSQDDCVLLLPFRHVLAPGIWGIPSDLVIRMAIDGAQPAGGTALHDAIAMGFYRLDHDLDRCWVGTPLHADGPDAPRRRPALVVVTDGLDEHSVMTFDGLLGIARQAGAPFLPVGFGEIASPTPILRKAQSDAAFAVGETPEERALRGAAEGGIARAARSASELKGMARVTGGQFIRAGSSQEKLNAAYEEVIRWLRSYYLIGYYRSSSDAKPAAFELPTWHEVEVQLRRPGYQIHTRAGYYRTPVDVLAADRHVQAAVDLIAKGEAASALDGLDLALQDDPYSWEAYYHIGEALLLMDEPREAQKALLRAAELSPGRGDVHELACRVSIELADYDRAWDQAIRAQQAEINMTEELLLLRQESTPPADAEERLQAPRLYIESFGSIDLPDEAAMRLLSLALSTGLAEVPEIGLIDLESLSNYRLLIRFKKLAGTGPRQLEADLELWETEAGGGDRIIRGGVTISDIENQDVVAEELTPHITELRKRLSEHQRR